MNVDKDQDGHVNLHSTMASNDRVVAIGREGSSDQGVPYLFAS